MVANWERVEELGFKIPLGDCYVTDYHTVEKAAKAVACLTCVPPVSAPGSPLSSAHFNGQAAKVLKVLLGQASLVCLEAPDGAIDKSTDNLDVMGTEIGSALREMSPALRPADKPELLVYGVDDAGLAQEMHQVDALARGHRQEHDEFIAWLRGSVNILREGLEESKLSELLRLRADERSSLREKEALAQRLLDFARCENILLPRQYRHFLRALNRMGSEGFLEENEELLERIDNHAVAGLLNPFMTRHFPEVSGADDPDAISLPFLPTPEIYKVEDYFGIERLTKTTLGLTRMCPQDIEALRFCRNYALGAGQMVGIRCSWSEDSEYKLLQGSGYSEGEGRGDGLSEFFLRNIKTFDKYLELARILGVDLNDYPHFQRQAELNRTLAGSGGIDFLRDFENSLHGVWSFLGAQVEGSAAEKRIWYFEDDMDLLEKLCRLELVPSDYGRAMDRIDEFSVVSYVNWLRQEGVRVRWSRRRAAHRIDKRRDRLLKYYDLARRRASMMAMRTVNFMESTGREKAVLVCLGFHVSTVMAYLKGQDVSAVAVFPRSSEGGGD